MYIILTGYICRFYKKMFITIKKLMFAIITGKYILITGNIYRYYKECESHIKVMFVIFTRMYSQLITRNV